MSSSNMPPTISGAIENKAGLVVSGWPCRPLDPERLFLGKPAMPCAGELMTIIDLG